MKVLFNILKNFDEWINHLDRLKDEFPKIKFEISNGFSELTKIDHEVIITTRFTLEDLNKCKNLKLLIAPKSGLDKWPSDALNEHNISYMNSNANSKFVAERALGLSLSLLGRINEFDKDLRQGEWFNWGNEYKWTSLSSLKCGIIGFGNIGKKIHRLLNAFDCQTYIYTRTKSDSSNNYLNDFRKFLKTSDLIFISAPLNSKTENLINETYAAELENKYIVNVSRASIINEKFLYFALKNKILRGAAIDVWYNNPDKLLKNQCAPSTYPFNELDNVIMSPHASSHAFGSSKSLIEDSIDKLRSYILKNI